MIPDFPEGKILIQFDGICVLCSRTVRFILKADRNRKFIFQTLQNANQNDDFDSIRVYDHHSAYHYFDAVLKIGEELGGIFRFVSFFRLFPRSWRNSLYKWIALNRYYWFGKRETCYLPSAAERNQFL